MAGEPIGAEISTAYTETLMHGALNSTVEGLRVCTSITGANTTGLNKDLAVIPVTIDNGYATFTLYPRLASEGHANLILRLQLYAIADTRLNVWVHSTGQSYGGGTRIVNDYSLLNSLSQLDITFPIYTGFDLSTVVQSVVTISTTMTSTGKVQIVGGTLKTGADSEFVAGIKAPYENLYLDLIYKDHPLAGWTPQNTLNPDSVVDSNIKRMKNYYGSRPLS